MSDFQVDVKSYVTIGYLFAISISLDFSIRSIIAALILLFANLIFKSEFAKLLCFLI